MVLTRWYKAGLSCSQKDKTNDTVVLIHNKIILLFEYCILNFCVLAAGDTSLYCFLKSTSGHLAIPIIRNSCFRLTVLLLKMVKAIQIRKFKDISQII